MENRALGVLAATLFLCCTYAAPATSEPLRVLYAEPFQAQASSAPGAQKAGPPDLRVRAFGRSFELELEDNSRLLRATSAQTRERIGAIQLLKGTIKDVPDSWVRLTLNEGQYSGAFWDGMELYAIAPRAQLDSALVAPLTAGSSGIYRLSDTRGGLLERSCGVAGTPPAAGALGKFRSLVRELRTAADTAFAGAPRRIEISMVGDFEFTSRLGAAALSTMVERMNVVDGIFSSQVGVATIPTDFITFSSNTDPFTSSEAATLLNQFADYRNNTPQVRNRGLAHLLTGRPLNGDTAGIAFLGSLCRAREGSGLSESSSLVDSALIIAHEIGHNFGAPHDGEPGSPCAATSQSFLMAPRINGSTTFSACSLQQMQPVVDAAPCVIASGDRDVGVSVPVELVSAPVGQDFDVVFDVRSLGSANATGINLQLTVPFGSTVAAASMPGANCSIPGATTGGTVRCDLLSLAAGETARLTLRMRHVQPALFNIPASVTSIGDSNAANDQAVARVLVTGERDVTVTATPAQQTATRGEPFEITFDATSVGTQTANDVTLQSGVGSFTILSFTADSGTCQVMQSNPQLVCALGSMPPGSQRRVRIQLVADRVGEGQRDTVRVFEAANPTFQRSASFTVEIQAVRDVSIEASSISNVVVVGADAVWPVVVRSNGVGAVDDVHVRVSVPPGVTVSVDDAACAPVATELDCPLGTMSPGAATTLTVRARAASPLRAGINVRALLSTPDEVSANDSEHLTLDVRLGTDIALPPTTNANAFEAQSHNLQVTANARGANPSTDIHLTASLPASFTISSAQFGPTQCTVQPGAANIADCSVAQMAPDTERLLNLTYVPSQPGVFTGSVSVVAAGDANTSNNGVALTFNVAPDVDGHITVLAPPSVILNTAADLVFIVTTNRYALPNAQVDFNTVGALDESPQLRPARTAD